MQEVALKPTKIIISEAHASDHIKYVTETCKNITTTLVNNGYKTDIITILNSKSFDTKYKLPFRILQDQEKFSIDRSIELKKNLNNEVFLVTNLGSVKIFTLEKASDFNYICNEILKHFSFYRTNDPSAFIARIDIFQHALPNQVSYTNSLNENDLSKISSATSDLHISIWNMKTISIFIDKDLQTKITEVFQSLPAEKRLESTPNKTEEESKPEKLEEKTQAKENKPDEDKSKEDIILEESSSWIDWAYSQATPKNALIAGGTLAIGFAGYKGLNLLSPASSTAIVEHAAANSPLRNLVAAVTNSPLVKQVAVVGFTETYTSPGGGFDRDDMHPTTPNYSSDNGEEIDTPGANELLKTVMKTANKLNQKIIPKSTINQGVNKLILRLDHEENSWLQGKQEELRTLLVRFMDGNTKDMSKERIYDDLLKNYHGALEQKDFEKALSNKRTKEAGKCKALGLDNLCKTLKISPNDLLNDILNASKENQYILYLAMMLAIPLTQATKITSEELNHNSTAWDDLSGIDDLDEDVDVIDTQENQTASAEVQEILPFELHFEEIDNSWSAQAVDGLVTFVPTIISYALLGQSLQLDYVQAITQNIDPVNMYLINGLIVQKSSEGFANAYHLASDKFDQFIGDLVEEAQ